MDLVSSCASVVAVLTVAGQSCSFLFQLLRDFRNAPKEICTQCNLLKHLRHTFSNLHTLYDENGEALGLSEHFLERLRICLADLQWVEAKMCGSDSMLLGSRPKKALARMIWSLSSHDWLHEFFARVRLYYSEFGLDLIAAQM